MEFVVDWWDCAFTLFEKTLWLLKMEQTNRADRVDKEGTHKFFTTKLQCCNTQFYLTSFTESQ